MSKQPLKIYWVTITMLLLPLASFAQVSELQCSKSGYTVATINGIFTKEGDGDDSDDGAKANRKAVKKLLSPIYNGESLTVDYLYNPTHWFFGAIDVTDVAIQKTFEGVDMQDPDFLKMLTDASQKVKTQKLLLVAHSQGNFYANNFYNTVTTNGDISPKSIGVYGVGSPANSVGGNGLYLTSSTDTVINKVRKVLPGTVLPANNRIDYADSDDSGNGHGFREIYLEYRGDKIKKGIEESLAKLAVNPNHSENIPCVTSPEKRKTLEKVSHVIDYSAQLTIAGVATAVTARNNAITDEAIRKFPSTMFAVLNTYNTTVVTAVWTYNTAVATAKFVGDTTVAVASSVYDAVAGVLADDSISNNNIASVILTTQDANDPPSTQPETSSQLAISQTTTSEPTSALFQLTKETSAQPSQTETQTLSKNSILADTGITEETPPLLLVKSTAPTQTETNSGYYGGGGSSPAPAAPVPQSDVTAPTITIIGDNPATISVNSEYVDTGATAADDVDGVISVTSTSTVNTAILGSYFVTYTAVDVSGNTATTTRAVNIVDTTAPEITINGASPATVFVGDSYVDAGATAYDDIDGARTVSSSSNIAQFTVGSYAVTYTATDLAGNTKTTIRTVNVIYDETMLTSSDLNGNAIPDSEESEVVVNVGASLSAGEYSFDTLKITASSTLTLMGTTTAARTFKGVKIVARNIIVDAGSSISADGQGYNQNTSGPGAAYDRDGASYGGVGYGNSASSTYGSAITPTELGSSGPSVCCSVNRNGGGAIRLVVTETLVNNGTISADANGPSTSGGSIYVTVGHLSGNGIFHANGGFGSSSYYTGAGGGGRVAIHYQTSLYGGTAEALGGRHDGQSNYGSVRDGTTGFFDTTNNNFSTGSSWRFRADNGPFNFNRIIIENGAAVSIEDGAQITANELALSGASSLSVGVSAAITIPTISVSDQSSLAFSGSETLVVNTLSVTGTSTISVAQGHPLVLSARDITISAGSSINVDGKGYSTTTGPGAPIEYYDGASYGGAGYNNSATSTYGSAFSPIDMGSGGNGHPSYAYGGGAVKITASGTITVNGAISANGGLTSSGGSVYIIADTFIGNGTISANGGGTYWSGYYIGPGGGGRIAIDSPSSLFSGSISASGTCYSSSGYIVGCSENGSVVYGASVASFDIATLSPAVQGSIDERAHTISLEVPYGTDVTAVAPTITVSRGASVSPASGEPQNFTDSVSYIVTSATSSTSTYTVTVTIAPEPDTIPPVITISAYDGITSTSTPIIVTATTSEGILNVGAHTFTENGSFDFIATDDAGNTATSTVTITNIDTSPPSIISYTFNETAGDITVDFATSTSVSFALTASENVDWVSIKIEDQNTPEIYKIFFSGAGCVDGTTTCVKSWDGTLSSGGGTAPNGIYRIKTNIRDMAGNIYQGYLSPYIITVNTVLP